MMRKTSGFTVIELMFVIVIGSILTMIAMSSFQNAQAAFAARSAKNMYSTLHQRARSRAIELGRRVYISVSSDGDSAYIAVPGVGVSDVTHFRRELNVDLRSTPSNFLVCMTPRGYANPSCPGSIGSAVNLEFWRAADSTTLIVLPMGQLVGM